MADWRDNLLDGSINGVPFKMARHSHAFGRRLARFSFIDEDAPANRDIGRKQREWNLELFVIEPNYFNKRDDLLDALEAPGQKTLVHPYLGEKLVETENGTLVEDDKEGGIARFTVLCVEAAEESDALFITIDTSIDKAADFVDAQVISDYERDVPSVSDFRSDFIGAIKNGTAKLRKVKNKITGALNVIDDLDGAIDEFDDALASLINTPRELASQLVGLTLSVLSLVGQVIPDRDQPGADEPLPAAPREELLLTSAEDILTADTAAPVVPLSIAGTARRATQKKQHDSLTATLQSAVASAAARVAVEQIEYESAADALETRNRVVALIRSLEPGSAQAFEALETLAAAAATQFQTIIADLPNLTTASFTRPRPAVVLAYALYEDAERAYEITIRNRRGGRSRNPLALEAHVDHEVLEV